MYKEGELVTDSSHVSVGVVIETKIRFGVQYCKVLWADPYETKAVWTSYEQLRDKVN